MRSYKLEVFEPPNERLRHRREISAPDDQEAIRLADVFYDGVAEQVKLDRYVLYEGDRVVRERLGGKG